MLASILAVFGAAELLLLLSLLLLVPPVATFGVVELLLLPCATIVADELLLLPEVLLPALACRAPEAAALLLLSLLESLLLEFLLLLTSCWPCPALGGATVGTGLPVATMTVSVLFMVRERLPAVLLFLLLSLVDSTDFTGLMPFCGSGCLLSLSKFLGTSVSLVICSGFSTVSALAAAAAGGGASITGGDGDDDVEVSVFKAAPVEAAKTLHTTSCDSSKSNGSTFISCDVNVE